MITETEQLYATLVEIYLFHMQDDEFWEYWLDNVYPDLLEEIKRRANEYLKEKM